MYIHKCMYKIQHTLYKVLYIIHCYIHLNHILYDITVHEFNPCCIPELNSHAYLPLDQVEN